MGALPPITCAALASLERLCRKGSGSVQNACLVEEVRLFPCTGKIDERLNELQPQSRTLQS